MSNSYISIDDYKSLIEILRVDIRDLSSRIEYVAENQTILNNRMDILLSKTISSNEFIKLNDTINQNDTNIIAHGEESYDFIEKDDLITIMQRGVSCIEYFIKHIYFNSNKLEYKNIYLTSIHSMKINIFTTQWEKKSADEIISNLYHRMFKYFNNVYNNNIHDVYNNINKHAQKFYDNLELNLGGEMPSRKTIELIRQTLYDNRHR